MKQYLFPSILMVIGLGLIGYGIANIKPVKKDLKVLQSQKEGTLTSVVYLDGKDTLALDYLTETEFNNLFKK